MKRIYLTLISLALIGVTLNFSACSSDDDNKSSISKADLIGTWYTLEDDWVLVFTDISITQYEIWKNKISGKYSLNSYIVTSKYSLDGNRIVGEDGLNAFVSIDGNILKVTNNNETYTYTKFIGSPQQLIDYLNNSRGDTPWI